MIVKKIEKQKNSTYKVTIDTSSYIFSEDVLLEFRLVPGHELEEEELEEALKSNSLAEYYSKTLDYVIRYGKSESKAYEYLSGKGVDSRSAKKIIDKLKKQKIINDDSLIDSVISSLVRQGNGVNLIREKLYQKGFHKATIDEHLSTLDREEYMASLRKLYEKNLHKYDKYEPYIRKEKLKQYLLSRGYTYSEIEGLEIN